MMDFRKSERPLHTIVGPRSEETSGAPIAVPNGIERLLTLAGLNAEWRKKILADPLRSATEAGIDLSVSEKAVLASLPAPALDRMIAPFAGKVSQVACAVKAAGLAAAALLATATSCDAGEGVVKGIRPDVPPTPPAAQPAPNMEKSQAPPIAWMDSLDDALAKAKESRRAVMAVFLLPEEDVRPLVIFGVSPAMSQLDERRLSQVLLVSDEADVRAAVKDANLLAVKVTKPAATDKDAQQKSAAYQTLLKKHDLDGKLPAVVFLAPDGFALSQLIQPYDKKSLADAVKAVPSLLAQWLTAQRQREVPASVTNGIRPDVPASKGMRADFPPSKP
jgi:hypothetical protein